MRTTSDLVAELAGDLRPSPRAWVARRIGLGFACGAVVATCFTLVLWGFRPDIRTAITTWPFWVKVTYTGLLAGAGVLGAGRVGRPGGRAGNTIAIAAIVFVAMGLLAVLQLSHAPAEARRGLVMGSTAMSCPWLIMLLSVPILGGGIWAVRGMAPTCLARAGAIVGLAAGATAALVYAMSCDESGMPFVLIWYGLGMAVPCGLGMALGRRLLRW